MAILNRTIIGLLISSAALLYGSAAAALDGGRDLRIGLIGADPAQILPDFDPFVAYLKSSLRRSAVRDVTVFVARDLDQMRDRIEEGKIDLVLVDPFPILEMEREKLEPSLIARQGAAREDRAVFFVRKRSFLNDLNDLQGKTVVFGTPSSTAGYAMAKAELNRNRLSASESTNWFASADAVRYEFAGEPVNQAFRVILNRADAGVFSSSDWEGLAPTERSQLRIIHRTGPVSSLLGAFHPSFPSALRETVEKTLVDMSGSEKGRAALATALHVAKFERLTQKDRNSFLRFKQLLSDAD